MKNTCLKLIPRASTAQRMLIVRFSLCRRFCLPCRLSLTLYRDIHDTGNESAGDCHSPIAATAILLMFSGMNDANRCFL